jgi:transketolase
LRRSSSNGHITCFYSVLARSGYFPVSELATFRLINSRLQGQLLDGLPGIRIASGSLGQGMSVKKLNNDDHLVYTLHGDELQEGQNWGDYVCF